MISVVVAIYNVEKYITKCLESIVNQDYADFELILVNDGSTDNSEKVIKNYLKNLSINWKLINKDNGGQSSARNIGYKNAKGDYIVFIDSDDVISRDFLSSLYAQFDNNIDIVFCNYAYVPYQVAPIDNNNSVSTFNRNELLKLFLKRTIDFVIPSMMFRKSFLDKNNISFNEDIRFSEDQMYMWETIFACKKTKYLYKKMYGYYLREKSIMTASPYEKISKAFDVYKGFTEDLVNKYPNDKKLIEMILPRWELGTLFSMANLVSREEYFILYKKMQARTILFRIIKICEVKAYLLAVVSFISCNLLRILCRKMCKNG